MVTSVHCSGTEVPLEVSFIVVDNDEASEQSNPASVVINFESIDNPPILDLNGPQQPTRDNAVTFVEGSDPIMVSHVWVWLKCSGCGLRLWVWLESSLILFSVSVGVC